MELVYLPFSHAEIPVTKTFLINGVYYNITIQYNDRYDFYTILVCDSNDTCIFSGKLSYLRNAIDAVVAGIHVRIIPLIIEDVMRDISQVERISAINFDSMRICVL